MTEIPAALQFMFAPGETPWAPLPDPGVKPDVSAEPETIWLDSNPHTIAAGQAVYGNHVLYFNWNHSDFDNNGTLWVDETAGQGYNWAFGTNYWGTVKNFGSVVALGVGNAAAAHQWSGGVFQNFGSVVVVSKEWGAFGVWSYSLGLYGEEFEPPEMKTPYINAGEMSIWAGTRAALGIALINGGHIQNSGVLILLSQKVAD